MEKVIVEIIPTRPPGQLSQACLRLVPDSAGSGKLLNLHELRSPIGLKSLDLEKNSSLTFFRHFSGGL
jgi:hypothetical protein